MKIALILGLFFAIVIAEEKINLEDIERDNLRAESKSGTDNAQNEETESYVVPTKQETIKSKYQQQDTRHYENNDEEITDYVGNQQLRDKYNDYQQDVKYLTNNVEYQQAPQSGQYSEYQHQAETPIPKSHSEASNYETPQQQFYYEPEVSVGNHYQSVQQKTASEKFVKNSNKETLYVNIPMSQLLSYYPNIALEQSTFSKSQVQPLLHRLTTQNQQIAIPIYMPPFNRDPIYSNSKITYQIQPQYESSQERRYPQITEAILPTRSPSKLIYAQGPLSHRQQPQSQTHYLQEIVYNQQPGALTYVPAAVSSSHDTSSYERPSSSHPESTIPRQNYASQSRQEQSYTPYDHHRLVTNYALSSANYPQQVTNQIYQQQSDVNVQQDYENIPSAPESEIDLPRLPAQNFKTTIDNSRLPQRTRENTDSHYANNHLIHTSEPRSLLESYIPSNLLAAQNSEQYRERPIKLERGFLPSKINFVRSYDKRKVD